MNKKEFICIKNAVKKFNNKTIFEQANINFYKGNITAIVSPNGSGKTTTINIILGFMNLDQGEIVFSDGIRHQDIAIVFGGEKNLYMKNTVKENIYYMSMLKGMNKDEILHNINHFKNLIPAYNEIENTMCERLSHGQKRLVSILAALVSNSKVIILDETTEGLDKKHIDILSEVLNSVKKDKIIILCSQNYEFVDRLADEIYFLAEHKFLLKNSNIKLEEEFNRMFGR